MNIPTPHIEITDLDKIAKTVLMPGDPLRAKFMAETFLENVSCVNTVRNMLCYTGYYKGRKVSVMGSGMGMPSIGIYSYELYQFYGVEQIIRIGSCGAYDSNLNLFDMILADSAYSESTFAQTLGIGKKQILKPTKTLNTKIKNKAKKMGIDLITARIHSSDVFYRLNHDDYLKILARKCVAVEMEAFALFANAIATGKKAACILTVSDSLVTHAKTSSEEREKSFVKMMELALSLI